MDSSPNAFITSAGRSSGLKFVVLIVTFLFAESYASMGWAILSCIVLVSSFVLAGRSCDLFNLRRITISSFWYLTYLAMIFVPAFVVFSDQVSPYRDTFLLAVETILVTVPLGWWIVSYLLDFSPIETEVFFQRPVVPLNDPRWFNQVYVFLLAGSAGLTVLYLKTTPVIPFFSLITRSGDYLELALSREDSFKLLNSRFVYTFYMVRGVLYPLLIALAFGLYLSLRQAKWLRIFVLVLCLGVFFAALSIAKSPVAAIFLILAFLYYYHCKGAPSRKIIATFFILIFAFPIGIVLGVSTGLDVGVPEAAAGTARRLFYLPAEVVYFYFEMFPKETGYLHGRSIGKLAWLLGEEPEDVTQSVTHYMVPRGIESGTANAAFLANWHADFGQFGVLLGGVLAGALMQACHIGLVRRRKNAITLAIYAFLAFAFWLLQSTSLPIVLLSDGVVPTLLLAWFMDGNDWRYRIPGTLSV